MASDFEALVYEKLSEIHAEQRRQGVILETHEQRSTDLHTRLVPIERHVAAWSGVSKALAVVLGVVGGVAALWRVVG